jgi:hypothetical protein
MSDSRQRHVALVGAYDRFNYGDLLFPLITNLELRRRGITVQTRAFSLLAADLSQFGAIPNRCIKELYDSSFLRDGDVCIINGGGTLGVDWTDIYSHTLGPRGNTALYFLGRLFGRTPIDKLIRWYFGGQSCTPFIAAPADFRQRVSVLYNAVGGSEIEGLPPALRDAAYASLQQGDYLSVRDANVRDILQPHAPADGVHLAPDSAVVMSRHYPLDGLLARASPSLRALLDEPYVCIQANFGFGSANTDALRALCESVYRQHGLRALLLPIGRYTGLDDGIYLRALSKDLTTPNALVPENSSITDIMLVIAKSALFLGTSLHGNITAQSFAVPHLGLNPQSPKLGAYLQTCDIEPHQRCVDMRHLDETMVAVARVMATPASARDLKRDELIQAASTNFDHMFQAAGLV